MIIIFLMVLLAISNEERKLNYEKGYNARQAEIIQWLQKADNQCNITNSGKRSGHGVMLDDGIRLFPAIKEDNSERNYYPNIVYQCRTERDFLVDAIWIGNSRCECITFDLK